MASALAPPNSVRSVTLSSVPESRSTTRALPRSKRDVGPRIEVRDQRADPGPAAKCRQQLKPVRRWAAKHRHLPRPGNGMAASKRSMGGLILGQLRQVQQHYLGCAEHHGFRRATTVVAIRAAGRGLPDPDGPLRSRVPRHPRWRRAAAGCAARHGPASRHPPDQAPAARAATKRCCFPPGPGFHQSAAAAALGLLGRDCHGKALRGDPGRIHRDAARLDEGGVVILIGARHLPFQRLWQFGLLRAGQFQSRRPRGRPPDRRGSSWPRQRVRA